MAMVELSDRDTSLPLIDENFLGIDI